MTLAFGPKYDAEGAYFEKASGSALVYGLDWSGWLTEAGGLTVSSSTWSGDAGITVTPSAISGGVTSALISGGTVGQTYWITNTIGASDSVQSDSASFRIVVVERKSLKAA